MPDGQHVIGLMSDPTGSANAAPPQINVVLNWFEEVRQRLPVR
jgi:hypothetical protein